MVCFPFCADICDKALCFHFKLNPPFLPQGCGQESVQRNVRMPTGCYHQCPYLPLAGAPAQRKQPAHPTSQGFTACCSSHQTLSGDQPKTHNRATFSIFIRITKTVGLSTTKGTQHWYRISKWHIY